MTKHVWDFDYAPISIGGGDTNEPCSDVVVATESDVDSTRMTELLRTLASRIEVTCLSNVHPVHWARVEASEPLDRQELAIRLAEGGIQVRYVASSRQGSQALPPSLKFDDARPLHAVDWTVKQGDALVEEDTPWRWFLRENGTNVQRAECGTGAGTRLALIDDDGAGLDAVELNAELLVGVDSVPRSSKHAALLLGWCVGACTPTGRFHGVAPHASPRLYCIPKPGLDVFTLPLAIVRAVNDGADVIVCATFVDGQTSPMLDDALELAVRLGRRGRGTVVVMPASRQISSPRNSRHASLSLGLFDPASDPRVFCVGPSARDGQWFLWRDKKGKLRPFANRGPTLRFLAPGDDLALPFSDEDRPTHAESSGASALAGGVTLLLLGQNPELSLNDLHVALMETAAPVDAHAQLADPTLGDPADLTPSGRDPDGHNAKHGYGRLDATSASLVVSDPFTASLVRIGERSAAIAYGRLRTLKDVRDVYSARSAAWAARVLLRERSETHLFAALARAVRLYIAHPEHLADQPPGHLLRQIGLGLRALISAHPPEGVLQDLEHLERSVRALLSKPGSAAVTEHSILATLSALWEGGYAATSSLASESGWAREGGAGGSANARLSRA